jgi:hypothetical protein
MRASRIIMAIVFMTMVAQPAWASIEYMNGKVVKTGPYDGPPVTLEDLPFIGSIGTGAGLLAIGGSSAAAFNAIGGVLAVGSFMAWGATRTAKYRSEGTKELVRKNLWLKHNAPKPGTIGAVLGQ